MVLLGSVVVVRVRQAPARVRAEARAPAALTAVAGTAVLGVRLTPLASRWAAAVLLGMAVAFWLLLFPRALRHLEERVTGAAFMLTVSTGSLAVLGSVLARAERSAWLLAVSLATFGLGLAMYGLVLRRFDHHELLTGAGDHWLTGGALAISALAAGAIELAAQRLGASHAAIEALRVSSLAVWVSTMLWLPVLIVCEAASPRWSYGVRRWSTVFPVGMYAACSFAVGDAVRAPAIIDFARAWLWVAVGVWLLVALGALKRGVS